MLNKILLFTALSLVLALVGCQTSDPAAADDPNSDRGNLNRQNEGVRDPKDGDPAPDDADPEPSPAADDSGKNADAPDGKNDSAGKDKFENIKPAHAEILAAWLKTKPHLKLARPGEFPADQLKRFRDWKKNPNAHPYYAAGDFNKDGREDFAVLLNNEKTGKERSLAVFEAGSKAPDFFNQEMFEHFILSFDREKKVLYISSFESDDGVILTPKGDSYILESMLPEV